MYLNRLINRYLALLRSKSFICILFSVVIVYNSCKKSGSEDDGLNLPHPKIKRITYYAGGAVQYYISLEYDSSGRLSKKTFSYGNYELFNYGSDKILIDKGGPHISRIEYDTLFLNIQGLVISEDRGYTTHEYDQAGYQAKIIQKGDNAYTLTYTISGGNTIKRLMDYKGSLSEDSYKYLPNQANTIGNENMGITYYGKQDKNLVHEISSFYVQNATTTTSTYIYAFDSQNRVVKSAWDDNSNDIYTTYTYYE
jgi:hypothetical protein